MKQILIQKNDQIRELSGSRIEFYNKSETLSDGDSGYRGVSIDDRRVTKVTFPFSAKILSGGTLDLDFTLPEEVAAKGVSLLGAYWDGSQITAYFRALMDLPQFVRDIEPLLIGTLVQVTTMKQIETDMLNGVVNVEESGKALSITTKPASKRSRARRKDVR